MKQFFLILLFESCLLFKICILKCKYKRDRLKFSGYFTIFQWDEIWIGAVLISVWMLWRNARYIFSIKYKSPFVIENTGFSSSTIYIEKYKVIDFLKIISTFLLLLTETFSNSLSGQTNFVYARQMFLLGQTMLISFTLLLVLIKSTTIE